MKLLCEYFLRVILTTLAIAAFVAAMNLRANAFMAPTEPPVEELDHWTANFVQVEIFYRIDGFMVGYGHPVRDFSGTTEQPGKVWTDGNQIFLVTADPDHPSLYVVEKAATVINHKMIGIGWQPLIIKTWNTTCGCPQ